MILTYHPRALQTWNRDSVHGREDCQGRVEVVLFNARSSNVQEVRDRLCSLFWISTAQNNRLNPSSQLHCTLVIGSNELDDYNSQYWNELSSWQSWRHSLDPRKTARKGSVTQPHMTANRRTLFKHSRGVIALNNRWSMVLNALAILRASIVKISILLLLLLASIFFCCSFC